jgi:hypothetical protein
MKNRKMMTSLFLRKLRKVVVILVLKLKVQVMMKKLNLMRKRFKRKEVDNC